MKWKQCEEYLARILPALCVTSVITSMALYTLYYIQHNRASIMFMSLFTILTLYYIYTQRKQIKRYAAFFFQKLNRLLASVLLVISVSVITLCVGIAYEQSHQPDSGYINNDTYVVSQYPDNRYGFSYLTLQSLDNAENVYRTKVTTSSAYRYGDIVTVSGKMIAFEPFVTDSGAEFDMKSYMSVHNVTGEIKNPSIHMVGYMPPSQLVAKLYAVRTQLLNRLYTAVPESVSGLVSGITFGDTSAITSSDKDMYRSVGLSHITVLSGFNITILLMSLITIGKRLNITRSKITSMALFACLVFTLFSGTPTTLLRATGMALLLLSAHQFSRNYSIERSLLYILTAIALYNPRIMLYDVGFQLSVIATAGIVFFQKNIADMFTGLAHKSFVTETISTTLAVACVAVPYQYMVFGTLSAWMLIANIFVVPIVPFIMYATLVAVPFLFISKSVATVVLIPALAGSKYISVVSHFLTILTPQSTANQLLIFFVSLLCVFAIRYLLLKRR